VTATKPRAASSTSAWAAELAFAVEIANRAGELLMARYERVERIDYKSARDVVTEVDHLSEALILDAIRATYPADALLAEETGEHHGKASGGKPATGQAPTSGSGRVWVVDPLDGTINYANGIPFFCVSVAMVEDGRPVVGVVVDPTRGETFAAAGDAAATLNGEPIAASDKDKLSDFVISMALAGRSVATRAQAVRKLVRVPRSMGSAALALVYVANGRFDAFVQQGGLSTWDIAAAGLIAERGGATVTSLAGGPWFEIAAATRTSGVQAAPSAHHETLSRPIAAR
jgi:myo-inositol-1(or 4)-monophosphatase